MATTQKFVTLPAGTTRTHPHMAGPILDQNNVVTGFTASGGDTYPLATFALDSSGNVTGLAGPSGMVMSLAQDRVPADAAFILASASTSAQTVGVSASWSDDLQFSVADDFFWVAPVFANYDTTQSITINKFAVAAAATNFAVQNTLTWTAGTVAGSASVVLAQATTGAGGQIIPSIAVADPVPLASLARSDSGTVRLVRVVETLATTGGSRNIAFHGLWTVGMTAINADAASGGAQVGGTHTATADWVTTPTTAVPQSGSFSVASPTIGVLVGTGVTRATGVVFGDSRDMGTQSSGGYMSWANRNNFKNGYVTLLNLANASQKTVDTIATMKQFVTAYNPGFVTIAAWSPNDGSTLAQANAAWGAVLAAIEWCRQKKVVVVLRTPIAASASSYPYGLTMYQRALALKPSRYLAVVDMTTSTSDGAFNLVAPYNSGDNLHPNDAGYKVLADTFFAATSGLF